MFSAPRGRRSFGSAAAGLCMRRADCEFSWDFLPHGGSAPLTPCCSRVPCAGQPSAPFPERSILQSWSSVSAKHSLARPWDHQPLCACKCDDSESHTSADSVEPVLRRPAHPAAHTGRRAHLCCDPRQDPLFKAEWCSTVWMDHFVCVNHPLMDAGCFHLAVAVNTLLCTRVYKHEVTPF